MKNVAFFPLFLGLLLLVHGEAGAEGCVTGECHPAVARWAKPHQPAKDGECLACHEQREEEHPIKGGRSFEAAARGAELCSLCHDPLGKMRVVHYPVREGDCLSCHQVHGGANRFLLDVGEDQSGLCFGCHDAAPFELPFVHGPAATGGCTLCHDPHQSTEKSLLIGAGRDLCLGCHQDFAQAMSQAGTVHKPVQSSPCTSCHDPHAARYPFLLKKAMPDLCLGCHEPVGKKLAGAKRQHAPLTQEGSCGNCHSTHFSKDKGLLPADEKSVCLGCHNVDSLARQPDKAKAQHGPIEKGTCSACHDPHGSDFPRLLTGDYPDGLYAPYQQGAYDFCLQCHEKNLLRFPDTTVFTNFRNGNLNLHFVHVVDKRKGRTCRVCHEPHAADGQKLIGSKGVAFGKWKIPIRFVPTQTGGSCAPGCHRPLKYDRQKPEVYGTRRR